MIVLGKNVVWYNYDSGVWKPYMCCRSISLSVTTDIIETSASGAGKWRTFEPTANSWDVSGDGIVSLNHPGALTLPELRAKQVAHEKLLMRYQRTSVGGEVYTDEGTCILTNSTDSASFDDTNIFSLTAKGTGALTQIFTPTLNPNPDKVKRYPQVGATAPATGGETLISIPLLANKDILGVWKDGVGNNDIILTGTPVGKEVLYQTNGDFTWAIPFEAGENYFIQYQDT